MPRVVVRTFLSQRVLTEDFKPRQVTVVANGYTQLHCYGDFDLERFLSYVDGQQPMASSLSLDGLRSQKISGSSSACGDKI